MSVSWPYEKNKIFLFESVFFKFLLQIILAYTIIKLLIPYLLNKNRKFLFFACSFVLIYIAFVTYSIFKYYYLIPSYPVEFANRPPFILKDRFTHFYAIIGSIPGYLLPTIILVIFNYYKQQKEIASLLDQKKTSELNALKNQLNPHFLFNTLNNLYTLALKKSDKTPEVIAKLSEILDYMLYQCKDNFVSINNEVVLLNNYISLEKVRYGKRLDVHFIHTIEHEVKIAPLLLLTLVENAFKHGVSQEIDIAKIKIKILAQSKSIIFNIENTKPKHTLVKTREGIGLQNIRKQLELLYSNNYTLDINDNENTFSVTLKITSNAI
jgi:sensor histidine kinase YesM